MNQHELQRCLFGEHPITLAVGCPHEKLSSLLPAEQVGTDTFSNTRYREFQAGRHFARTALARYTSRVTAITRGPNGNPLWPAGFVGSLSHTAQMCVAAVAPNKHIKGLGIDIAHCDECENDLWPRFCTSSELETIHSLPTSQRRLHATLMFSMKESFFKLQHPLTRQWLEFNDIQIERTAAKTNRVRIIYTSDQSCRTIDCHHIEARFAEFNDTVITATFQPYPQGIPCQ